MDYQILDSKIWDFKFQITFIKIKSFEQLHPGYKAFRFETLMIKSFLHQFWPLWWQRAQTPRAAAAQKPPGWTKCRGASLHRFPLTASWSVCGTPPSDTAPEPATQLHPEDRTQTQIQPWLAKHARPHWRSDVLLTLWSATPKNEIPVYKACVRALSWCPSAEGQTVKATRYAVKRNYAEWNMAFLQRIRCSAILAMRSSLSKSKRQITAMMKKAAPLVYEKEKESSRSHDYIRSLVVDMLKLCVGMWTVIRYQIT